MYVTNTILQPAKNNKGNPVLLQKPVTRCNILYIFNT